jgi:hypothetical protein
MLNEHICAAIQRREVERATTAPPPRIEVVQDDIWLCVDCLMAAVNGDFTGLDYSYTEDEAAERHGEIVAGLDALGPGLVSDFDAETGDGIEEFSCHGCDCCGSRLAGQLHRFAVLGEAKS